MPSNGGDKNMARNRDARVDFQNEPFYSRRDGFLMVMCCFGCGVYLLLSCRGFIYNKLLPDETVPDLAKIVSHRSRFGPPTLPLLFSSETTRGSDWE